MSTEETPAENAYDAYLQHHAELDAKSEAETAARRAREAKEYAEAPAKVEVKPEPTAVSPKPPALPQKPDHLMTPAERATAEFARFPELYPGAAEKLGPMFSVRLGAAAPEARAALAVKLMALPIVQRYVNPEYKSPTMDNGQPQSPLRATLSRYTDRIDPGKLDALHARLTTETVYKTPDAMAAHVVKFLASNAARPFLAPQPSRASDGRFAAPPAAKPATRRGSWL